MRLIRTSLLLILAALTVSVASDAEAHRWRDYQLRDKCAPAPLADGYIKQITMIADGTVADFNQIVLDPTEVWTEQFGRDEDYIAEDRSDALEFWESKFSLDGDQLMADGRALVIPFLFSPDIGYRAISVSGEAVGTEGWHLIDTGWQFVITDPNGVTIPDGQFAGLHLPPGAFMLFGEYHLVPTSIQDRCPRRYRPDPITIHYESGCPIIPGMMGIVTFVCDLTHPEWGEGRAAGVSIPMPNAEGGLDFDNRNIITFPPRKMD